MIKTECKILDTNPNFRGSLLFIWWEKNSSEHFHDAGETPPYIARDEIPLAYMKTCISTQKLCSLKEDKELKNAMVCNKYVQTSLSMSN